MLPSRLRVRLAAVLALLAVPVAAPLAAQGGATVSGTVVDSRTGEPLPAAAVEIVDSRRAAFTRADGSFRLEGVPRAPYVIHVRLLGYQGHTQAVAVAGDTTLPAIRLRPDPVLMEGITAVVSGFDRGLRNSPRAVTVLRREEIAAASASDAKQLVLGRMGIDVRRCPGDRGWVGQGRPGQVCVHYRGSVVPSFLMIDGMRAFGGYDELAALSPDQVFRVHAFNRGATVMVFTSAWVERNARSYAAQIAATREPAQVRRPEDAPAQP